MSQPAGSEFEAFAGEASELAETSWAAAMEGWPDEDWAGEGFDRRNGESAL